MDSPWINGVANPHANPVAGVQAMPIGPAGPALPARPVPMGMPLPGDEREQLTEVNESPSQGFATMLPSEYRFSILRQPCFPLDDLPPTEPREATIGYNEDANSYNAKKATDYAEHAAYKLTLTKWQATIAFNLAHFGGCLWGHPDGASKVLVLGGINGREDDPPNGRHRCPDHMRQTGCALYEPSRPPTLPLSRRPRCTPSRHPKR